MLLIRVVLMHLYFTSMQADSLIIYCLDPVEVLKILYFQAAIINHFDPTATSS
jgi:hypothetical protein